MDFLVDTTTLDSLMWHEMINVRGETYHFPPGAAVGIKKEGAHGFQIVFPHKSFVRYQKRLFSRSAFIACVDMSPRAFYFECKSDIVDFRVNAILHFLRPGVEKSQASGFTPLKGICQSYYDHCSGSVDDLKAEDNSDDNSVKPNATRGFVAAGMKKYLADNIPNFLKNAFINIQKEKTHFKRSHRYVEESIIGGLKSKPFLSIWGFDNIQVTNLNLKTFDDDFINALKSFDKKSKPKINHFEVSVYDTVKNVPQNIISLVGGKSDSWDNLVYEQIEPLLYDSLPIPPEDSIFSREQLLLSCRAYLDDISGNKWTNPIVVEEIQHDEAHPYDIIQIKFYSPVENEHLVLQVECGPNFPFERPKISCLTDMQTNEKIRRVFSDCPAITEWDPSVPFLEPVFASFLAKYNRMVEEQQW